MEIRGKTALVTGAAKRVGREIALHLASRGADIVLHYRSSEAEAKKTSEEIAKFGVRCHMTRADLAKSADISAMVTELEKKKIGVDILVNSASLFYKTPLSKVKESDWDAFLDSNLKGPFLLSQALGQKMAGGNGGKIINIADWSGFRPYKNYMPYCVSKGGLITLTKSLARDLAPKVYVNAIAPGPVLQPENLSAEENAEVVKKTLLGRWGTPQDIANAVSFLLESDFINGFLLVVDGGRSIA